MRARRLVSVSAAAQAAISAHGRGCQHRTVVMSPPPLRSQHLLAPVVQLDSSSSKAVFFF